MITATTATHNGSAVAEDAFQAVTKATSAAHDFAIETTAALGPSIKKVTDKSKELNDTWSSQTKGLVEQALDTWDASLHVVADFQRTAAASTKVDWMIQLTDSNAKLLTEMGTTYSAIVRDLLK